MQQDLIASILADIQQNDSPIAMTFTDTSPLFMEGPNTQLQELMIPMMNNSSSTGSSCLKLLLIVALLYLIYKCIQYKKVNNYSNYLNNQQQQQQQVQAQNMPVSNDLKAVHFYETY